MRRPLFAAAGLLAFAAPAVAVGLGPLSKEGNTDGPLKGFYLTVLNPYKDAASFTASAIGYDDEQAAPRVSVFPSQLELGGEEHMQILVVASDLAPGETYKFRVCAERAQPPAGVMINARVCSKLTAHRLVVPAADTAGAG